MAGLTLAPEGSSSLSPFFGSLCNVWFHIHMQCVNQWQRSSSWVSGYKHLVRLEKVVESGTAHCKMLLFRVKTVVIDLHNFELACFSKILRCTVCKISCVITVSAWGIHLLLLRCRTWMAGLTLAPEGSGSLSKLQTVHGLHHQRSCHHWGCRIPENKRWNRLNKSLQVHRVVFVVHEHLVILCTL